MMEDSWQTLRPFKELKTKISQRRGHMSRIQQGHCLQNWLFSIEIKCSVVEFSRNIVDCNQLLSWINSSLSQFSCCRCFCMSRMWFILNTFSNVFESFIPFIDDYVWQSFLAKLPFQSFTQINITRADSRASDSAIDVDISAKQLGRLK